MYKQILIFAGGALLGAAGGYFLADRLIKKKYELMAQQEINEVKSMYLAKCRKLDDIKKNDEQKSIIATFNPSNVSVDHLDIDKEIKNKINDMYGILSKTKYSNSLSATNLDGSEDRFIEDEPPIENLETPYVITPRDFVHTKRYYDKITLLYYEDDGTLATESDNMIEDIDVAIGDSSLDHFGEYEEDAVYVRNDRLSTDYEVLLQHGSFGDTT